MPTPTAEPVEEGWTEKGIASWYGEPYHGRRTASGEIYDMHELTAAHKTLAFGSVVKVTRRDTGADVKVRINDRGPFIEGRIIDLSFAAAKKIDLDIDGVAPVKIKVVGREAAPERRPARAEEPEDCFWVQVGAFGDPNNARRAEAELERNGERRWCSRASTSCGGSVSGRSTRKSSPRGPATGSPTPGPARTSSPVAADLVLDSNRSTIGTTEGQSRHREIF